MPFCPRGGIIGTIHKEESFKSCSKVIEGILWPRAIGVAVDEAFGTATSVEG
jgi:hypothetical protein